ncbi:diguanylate cyclase [Arcobacter sp. CECT 8985]|uniref:sensor domain-containing diguanylate cyclase n=1 Tax=Arcobacter sp. CECT 8985 TaxID=1935424 RepID=UPI00100ACED3|nr:diguanylate cyclase [Arcobacter sp. CECT 8985]RXJ86739.1 hypothetical protein CRU93_07280 [Arcobacter sp. CECT 8985]
MFKDIKLKLIYLGVFFILLNLIYAFSHEYFINRYVSIEKIHNKKNIRNLVKNISLETQFLNSIIQTYSKWDNAYYFLNGTNPSFEKRNFRDANELLKMISIEFLNYTNSDNITMLSCSKKSDTIDELFEKTKKILKNKPEASLILSFKGNIYYIIKAEVKKTDKIGKSVGYLYSAKLLNKSINSYINTTFQFIQVQYNKLNDIEDIMKTENLLVKYKIVYTDSFIINYLEVRDLKNRYITTLKVSNYRDFIVQIKNTTFIFNIIILIVLAIIFYLSYRHQIVIRIYTKKLEKDVERRTKELKQSNKELHELAYKDFLTKIDNRRSFFIKVQKILKDTLFRRDLVHIVMIDIDNFKYINDKHGHDVGDVVLKKFASILQKYLSHNDICARIGGEEFVIAFSNIETNEVLQIVEKIREETQNCKVLLNKDNYLNFTASFGISDNRQTNNIDKILHKADLYLYEVKQSGKNKIRYRK